MRIGIVCAPTYGGSGVVATELGRFLARRGHEIHFISSELPFRLHHDPEANIRFHEVQTMEYPVLNGSLYGIALASRIVQVVADHKLEIIHAHYAVPHAISAFMAREAVNGKGHPFRVMTTLHGTDITLVGQAESFFPIAKYAIDRSDSVTTVSEWLKAETIREFDIKRPIHVVPNFVDVERFRRGLRPCKRSHFTPRGEKIVLHISNFRPVKRVQDVVKVFDRIRKEVPSVLLMIGDGPEREGAERLARRLGMTRADVQFLGKQEAIELYMSCADLFLFPSEYESFGLAALEAMACEIPVVASDSGGLKEVIDHGVTGFRAPVGDIEAMAQHSLSVLKDEALARRIGTAARDWVHANYKPEHVVPVYERLYEQMLAGSAPAAPGPRTDLAYSFADGI